MSCVTTGGPDKDQGAALKTNWENLGGAHRGRRQPSSQDPWRWNPSGLRGAPATRKDSEPDQEWAEQDDGPETTANEPHSRKSGDCEPQGRAVLLGSLPLQLSLPNEISCVVSTCVSWDNSFLRVRQEPILGPWKGPPSYNDGMKMKILRLLPKFGLRWPLPNRSVETEFWVKEKKVTLLLCQAKEATEANALKAVPPTPLGEIRRWCYSLGSGK